MLQAYYAPAVCAPHSSGAVPNIAALEAFRGSPELRRASRRDRFASVSDHGGNAKAAGTAGRLLNNRIPLRLTRHAIVKFKKEKYSIISIIALQSTITKELL